MTELNHAVRHGLASWAENPVLVHGLGLSPLLALSNSFQVAVALLLCMSVVVLAGTGAYQLIKRHIKETWRVATLVISLAVVSTASGLVITEYFPDLSNSLGVYLLLLCCNFAVIVHILSQGEQQRGRDTIISSLAMLAGYGVALLAFAALRQLLTSGWAQFGFAATQPGALLLLGLVLAVSNALRGRLTRARKTNRQEIGIESAPRARVTEKLQ